MVETVNVTAEFKENFGIVARYYGFEEAGDMDAAKDIARKQIKEFGAVAIAEYAKMSAWMRHEIAPPRDEGVSYSGNGYEFCAEEKKKGKGVPASSEGEPTTC